MFLVLSWAFYKNKNCQSIIFCLKPFWTLVRVLHTLLCQSSNPKPPSPPSYCLDGEGHVTRRSPRTIYHASAPRIMVSLLHTPLCSPFAGAPPSREARAQIPKLVTSVLDPPSDQLKIKTQLPTPKHFLQYFNCFFSLLQTLYSFLHPLRRFKRIFPFRA